MSDAALPHAASGSHRTAARGGLARGVFVRVAWRNLWRRRLRTWTAVGGISFAAALVGIMVAFQGGVYGPWIDNATSLLTGHIQVQHPAYFDDPKMARTLPSGTALVRTLEDLPGVQGATARAEAFALVSVGERSYGAMVMGVDANREPDLFTLPGFLREGEYLPRSDSAFIGSSLAVNLGVALGDEIVALGTAKEGGVAALVLQVDGIFDTGRAEIDRSVLQAPLAAVQNAFELGDDVHRVVLKVDDPNGTAAYRGELAPLVPNDARLLDWDELLPELRQGIRLDAITARMMYWLLMIVVAMSVVNSFIMTVFERTREFGMLIAIGMRPNAIIGMLTIEALGMWAIGTAIGLALCVATVLPLNVVGVQVGALAEGVDDIYRQLMIPDSLRPELSSGVLLFAPSVLLVGTVLGNLVPALRVRRMRPVEALREEE